MTILANNDCLFLTKKEFLLNSVFLKKMVGNGVIIVSLILIFV